MTTQPRPLLLVYKEIVEADLRKLLATSNDAPTGGGARDLRLPARAFRPVMEQLFTKDGVGKGGRPIRIASITYKSDGGNLKTCDLEYWPATGARPSEDRVARVHASPALVGRLPDDDKGRVFLLFIKWDNGEVRCYYAYGAHLHSGSQWRPDVRNAILSCMSDVDQTNANRTSSKRSVQGYLDFRDGTSYCHG